MSLPSTQMAIKALRVEVEQIASTLAACTPQDSPVRRIPGRDVAIWLESPYLSVLTSEGAVFLSAQDLLGWSSGSRMEWWPDWTALKPSEARALAAALLGAAGLTDNELLQLDDPAHIGSVDQP
jgi:hypothetical protein